MLLRKLKRGTKIIVDGETLEYVGRVSQKQVFRRAGKLETHAYWKPFELGGATIILKPNKRHDRLQYGQPCAVIDALRSLEVSFQ